MQSGQTTPPGSNQDLPQEPSTPATIQADTPLPTPVSSPESSTEQPNQPAHQNTAQQPEYQSESTFEPSQPARNDAPLPDQVSWTASEYISHAKGPSWFMLLGLALFTLVGIIYFTTKDIIASALVGVAGLTFGIFAARPPQVLDYVITSQGITIGQRVHPFSELKSFAIIDNGVIPSLMLLPLKRFMPPITVYYEPKEEEAIVNMLAAYLPHEDKEPDFVDKLMGHIRF